ncbi:MAG: hypothetical protein Q4G05_00060 [Clostridia bacterium]|nr:hypothetical protein [Clostridia bacterium]
MDKIRKEIQYLITEIKQIRQITNDRMTNSVDGNISEENLINNRIVGVAEKKEVIIAELESKKTNISSAEMEQDEELNKIEKEQERLSRQIDSVSKTLKTYEEKYRDSISKGEARVDSYYVLLDNKNEWEKEFNQNKVTLKELYEKKEDKIRKQEEKIDEMISDIIDLNMKTVDTTRLLQYTRESEKSSTEDTEKQENIKRY